MATEKHPLRLYNTMTRRQDNFVPRRNREVKMFTCGPSIYSPPHLGNYRTFLFEDVLHRYLEYLDYRVSRLINFTDVEDKAIARARERHLTLGELTEDVAQLFFRDAGLLHIRLPDFIPRSSTSVAQAEELIGKLVEGGFAYRLGDDYFFDPLKFPGFGRLFGLDMGDWPQNKRRFRRDTYPGRRWNRGDFILWHGYRAARDGAVYWPSSLGKGRPAWNIQDAAMITGHLGYQIDISCGGVDNLYRHHDYTIAVIEAVSGREFASFWLHGEPVLLNGKKMSKSKGNIVHLQDFLDKGFKAAGLRYYLINNHYRRRLNLTEESLAAGAAECALLQKLAGQFTAPLPAAERADPEVEPLIRGLTERFEAAMNDDLRVKTACENIMAILDRLGQARAAGRLSRGQGETIRKKLLRIDSVLQILFE